MPRDDDPLVFSAGDVLNLLDRIFSPPGGEPPPGWVAGFQTDLKSALQARHEAHARIEAEFGETLLRLVTGPDKDKDEYEEELEHRRRQLRRLQIGLAYGARDDQTAERRS